MQEEPVGPEEPAMVEELMWVKRPAGANLFHSQKEPGSFTSGFLAPDSRILGQSTLRPPTDHEKVMSTSAPQSHIRYSADPRSREREEFKALLVEAGVVVTRELIRRATPVVLEWLSDDVIPSAKARVKAVKDWTGRRRATIAKEAATRTSAVSAPTAVQPPLAEVVHEAEVFDAHRRVIGRKEALERLRAARAAELFRDEQLRIVRESQVVDDDDLAELDDAGRTLAPVQLDTRGQLMLESTASPAEDIGAIQLSAILDADLGRREATPVQPA
ncbi:hypothetical protein ACX27O_15375 [Micromonospora sp. SD19]